MRFDDLEGFTALSIEQLRHQFRNEEVLTVLPVRATGSSRDTLLVATVTMLAILTGGATSSEAWMTRWAPWDAVRFADMGATIEGEEVFFLTILVGRSSFGAELHGETGAEVLRDFVIAVEERREALAATW